MKLILTLVIWSFSVFAQATPLTPEPTSILQIRGYYARPYQNARVVSFNPYRGDNVLDTLPVISAFQRILPDLPITIQTYFNELIVPHPKLSFIKPDLSSVLTDDVLMAFYNQTSPLTDVPLFKKAAEALAHQALPGLEASDSTLIFFNAFSLYCLFHEESASRHLVHSHQWEANARRMWKRYVEFKKMVELQIRDHLPAHSLLVSGDLLSDPSIELYESAPFYRHERVSYDFNEFTSLYELSSAIMKRAFGTDGRDLEQPLLFVRFGDLFEFKELLNSTFTAPQNEFIIFNFNTVGAYKLEALSKYQAKLAQELIHFVRLHFPHINIWITPPELPPGATPNVRTQLARQHELLRAYVKRPENQGVVAFLPEDKTQWSNAMRGAKALVSQDSGFVHMSNLVSPFKAYKTFVYSFEGIAHLWAKPSQPIANHLEARTDFSQNTQQLSDAGIYAIKYWLRRTLGSKWSPTADAELLSESLRLLSHEFLLERIRSLFTTLMMNDELTDKQRLAVTEATTEFTKLLPQLTIDPELQELIQHLMAVGVFKPHLAQFMPVFWDYIWKTEFAYTQLQTYLAGDQAYEGLIEVARQFVKLNRLYSLPTSKGQEYFLPLWQAEIAEKLHRYEAKFQCIKLWIAE